MRGGFGFESQSAEQKENLLKLEKLKNSMTLLELLDLRICLDAYFQIPYCRIGERPISQ